VQSTGRSSAHTSTKVKMLTPFSLRSRHGAGDFSTLLPAANSQQQQQQHQQQDELDAMQAAAVPRRRFGSERHLPQVTATAAAVVHAHRGSDGGTSTISFHAPPTTQQPSATTSGASDHTPTTVINTYERCFNNN